MDTLDALGTRSLWPSAVGESLALGPCPAWGPSGTEGSWLDRVRKICARGSLLVARTALAVETGLAAMIKVHLSSCPGSRFLLPIPIHQRAEYAAERASLALSMAITKRWLLDQTILIATKAHATEAYSLAGS